MVNVEAWKQLKTDLDAADVTLVAVSKTKPVSDIEELYKLGQRDFGENYVQELAEKHDFLPAEDIRWHYIGHLQTNKVKYIAPFVYLIHAVDSFKLLKEINKQAKKNERIIDVLLQLHIADEESKHGLDKNSMIDLLEMHNAQKGELANVRVTGLMGMATFTDDMDKVRAEFADLKNMYTFIKDSYFTVDAAFNTCSMGMSSDYKIAVEEGSTMVRVGSIIFGARNYNNA